MCNKNYASQKTVFYLNFNLFALLTLCGEFA